MDLDTLLATLQGAVDAITAFKNQPAPPATAATVTEVDVKESDGSEKVFVPETPEATA